MCTENPLVLWVRLKAVTKGLGIALLRERKQKLVIFFIHSTSIILTFSIVVVLFLVQLIFFLKSPFLY